MRLHSPITIFILLFFITLSLCTLFTCGGTSETGNAFASISGSIIINDCDTSTVWVNLVNENYFPGDDTAEMIFKTSVDYQGKYAFRSIPWNNYYLYIKGNDQNKLRGPITVTVPEVELGKDTLQYTSVVSVYTPDTASYDFIYIRGIPETFSVQPGYTTLPDVPSGLVHIIAANSTIRYKDPFNSNAYLNRFTINTEQLDTITIGDTNHAPVFSVLNVLSKTVTLDSMRFYRDTLIVTDPDSDFVTYQLSRAPEQMHCDSSGIITWKVPDCIDNPLVSVEAIAYDNKGASSRTSWTITIQNHCITHQSHPYAFFSKRQIYITDSVSAIFYNCYCSDSSSPSINISWGNGDTLSYSASDTIRYRYQESNTYYLSGQLTCSSGPEEWFNIDSIIVLDTTPEDTLILYGDQHIIIEKGTRFDDPGAVQIRTKGTDTTITPAERTGMVDHNTNGVYALYYNPVGDTDKVISRKVYVVSEDTSLSQYGLKAIDTIRNVSSVSITFSPESLIYETDSSLVRFRINQGEPSQWSNAMAVSIFDSGAGTYSVAYQYLDLERLSHSSWIENFSYTIVNNSQNPSIRIYPDIDTVTTDVICTLLIEGSFCQDNKEPFARVNWGDDTISQSYNPSTYSFKHSWSKAGTYTISIALICDSVNFWDSTVYTRTIRVKSGQPSQDTTIPVLQLNGDYEMVIPAGTVFEDPGATAYDLQDGDLTGSIRITGSVDVTIPGNYTLTYTVSDSSFNTVSANRVVTVQ
ncbi:MAG: DUF5011 domain-containing protein [Chitinispirillaceae bacterium]|nr:DUF5011 domain-containing protein [Chitinispirillaceae bacterium]